MSYAPVKFVLFLKSRLLFDVLYCFCRINNAKFSGYYYYMNTMIWRGFQICISVALISKNNQVIQTPYTSVFLDDKKWNFGEHLKYIARSHPLSTYANFPKKLKFLTSWYAQGVRNVSFSENFAWLPNKVNTSIRLLCKLRALLPGRSLDII